MGGPPNYRPSGRPAVAWQTLVCLLFSIGKPLSCAADEALGRLGLRGSLRGAHGRRLQQAASGAGAARRVAARCGTNSSGQRRLWGNPPLQPHRPHTPEGRRRLRSRPCLLPRGIPRRVPRPPRAAGPQSSSPTRPHASRLLPGRPRPLVWQHVDRSHRGELRRLLRGLPRRGLRPGIRVCPLCV
jgi:hypothetical protein